MSDYLKPSPAQIVDHVFENDAFSQWLGIEVTEVKVGACKLRCTVHDKMLNGYKIIHGGVIFSLADSAIAYASASYGRLAVSIDHSISFIKKVYSGETLTVKAETISMGHKTGVIKVVIKNREEDLIAVIKGTVYRKSETFEL